MQTIAIIGTKVAIAAVFAATLLAQITVIPAAARESAYRFPEAAELQVPGVVWAVLVVACVQIVLVCNWRLLSMVASESIFTESAFRYVNVMIGSCWAATALMVMAYVGLVAAGWPGPIWVWLGAGAILSTAVALLLIVMKGLLRKASQLERDMSEVV